MLYRETANVWPTTRVTVIPLSGSLTLTSGLADGLGLKLAGTASFWQPEIATGPVPDSNIPKVVDAPGASAPLYGWLTAVNPAPEVPAVPVIRAFHAEPICWPAARLPVTVHI